MRQNELGYLGSAYHACFGESRTIRGTGRYGAERPSLTSTGASWLAKRKKRSGANRVDGMGDSQSKVDFVRSYCSYRS